MDDEILACIDEKNIRFLQSGQVSKYVFPISRKKAHKEGICHLIVRFFVMAITPEGEILYLVQKRSKNKRSYPGYFTDSASGHVVFKEKLNLDDIKGNAKRELEEEFGVSPKTVNNIFFYDINVEEDKFTKEFAYIFFGLIDHDAKLAPSELELDVNESKFFTKSELEHLLKQEKLVDYTKKVWNKLINIDVKKLFKEEQGKKKDNNKIPLFIGRFQPLHKGHLHVITNILERHDRIKIGIGSSQLSDLKNDPFTSEERKQFIESTLESEGISRGRYEIFEIPDIFNARTWVEHVTSIVGDVDIIYSNSEWVRELFQNKGYALADKLLIEMEKYNATVVRNAINNDNNVWLELVPESVSTLVKEFNGIGRIKNCYKKD